MRIIISKACRAWKQPAKKRWIPVLSSKQPRKASKRLWSFMVSASALESSLAHHRSDNLASNIFQQAPLNPRVHLTLTHCQTPDRCSDNLLLSFGERWRNQCGSCALTAVLTPRDQGTGGTGGQSWLASARPVLTKTGDCGKEAKQSDTISPTCLLPRDSASISTVSLCYTPSHHPVIQWEFQDPKIEVLYHIRPYFVGIFSYIFHQVYLLTVIHQSYPPRPWPISPSFKLGSSRDLRSWWNWTSSRMPCAWSMAALGIKKENPWLWDISPSLIYIYNIGMYA